MTDEKVFEVCKRLNKYLKENGIYESAYPYGSDMPVVEIEISWGDWKHDHLRLKWLMEDIGAIRVSYEVTEENGSDCYSAIHRFIITEDILKNVA